MNNWKHNANSIQNPAKKMNRWASLFPRVIDSDLIFSIYIQFNTPSDVQYGKSERYIYFLSIINIINPINIRQPLKSFWDNFNLFLFMYIFICIFVKRKKN
jgi:hypothetical protein